MTKPDELPAVAGALDSAPAATSAIRTSVLSTRELEVGRLELREEVPVLEKRREQTGQVQVRREVRTRSETLSVELTTEVLVIETQAGGPSVMLDGVALAPGETREVVLYREEAAVVKQPVLVEEVRVLKQTSVERQVIPLDLAYEELVVEGDTQLVRGAMVRPGPAAEVDEAGRPA